RDWSSDVCSSDLVRVAGRGGEYERSVLERRKQVGCQLPDLFEARLSELDSLERSNKEIIGAFRFHLSLVEHPFPHFDLLYKRNKRRQVAALGNWLCDLQGPFGIL